MSLSDNFTHFTFQIWNSQGGRGEGMFCVEQRRLSDLNLITRLSGGWLSLPPSMILQPVSCSNCFLVKPLPPSPPRVHNSSHNITSEVPTDLLFVPHGSLASHHHLAPSLLLQLLGCQPPGSQDPPNEVKLKQNQLRDVFNSWLMSTAQFNPRMCFLSVREG